MAKLLNGFHQKGEMAAMGPDTSNLAGKVIPENRDKDIVSKISFIQSVIKCITNVCPLFFEQEMDILLNR